MHFVDESMTASYVSMLVCLLAPAGLFAGEPAVSPCICQVVPLSEADFQAHPKHRGSDSDSLKVLVTAKGWERSRHPGTRRYWYLFLPEGIRGNENGKWFEGEDWRPQVPQTWREKDGYWRYEGTPLRNLWGLWKYNTDGKHLLDQEKARQRPVIGSQSAGIFADETGVHYYVRIKNTSKLRWADVHGNVCFNSFLSPETGHRPYVNIGGAWKPYQEIAGIRQHAYLPPEDKEQQFCRSRLKGKWADIGVPPSLSAPAIVAWNFVGEEPLLTCHYSRDAVGLGANQDWPCTDLYMWFGDLEPGQQKVCWGHVVIMPTRLSDFARQFDSLRKKWHERERQ